jgi:hypothetical protein
MMALLKSESTLPAAVMKRPFGIYLVAFWCFFALMVEVSWLTDPLKARLSSVPAIAWTWLNLAAVIFVIWQIQSLVRLKRTNRVFAVALFAFWSLHLLTNVVGRLPELENVARTVIAVLSFCVLNVASIWYLSRKSFREFADNFSNESDREKHSREMQKVAQKKVSDELRS